MTRRITLAPLPADAVSRISSVLYERANAFFDKHERMKPGPRRDLVLAQYRIAHQDYMEFTAAQGV